MRLRNSKIVIISLINCKEEFLLDKLKSVYEIGKHICIKKRNFN